jgi:hypothetical protein
VAFALSLAVLGVGSAGVGPFVRMPGSPPAATATPVPSAPAPAAAVSSEETGSVRITMTVGDRVATATLADTLAGHQLAAVLPITVDLHDRFGQAKSGALPRSVDVAGLAREFHPITGGIYYWPDGRGQLAVFYDALGQAVPPPGLIRLGNIDTGLNAIGSGGDVTVTIQRAD